MQRIESSGEIYPLEVIELILHESHDVWNWTTINKKKNIDNNIS